MVTLLLDLLDGGVLQVQDVFEFVMQLVHVLVRRLTLLLGSLLGVFLLVLNHRSQPTMMLLQLPLKILLLIIKLLNLINLLLKRLLQHLTHNLGLDIQLLQ